jgi:hypothetical protein
MSDIEERLFNATEGKWYRNNNKIVVMLPEISFEPITIAEFPEDTIGFEENLNFLLNSKSDIVYLINENKRLRSLLEVNFVDYVI